MAWTWSTSSRRCTTAEPLPTSHPNKNPLPRGLLRRERRLARPFRDQRRHPPQRRLLGGEPLHLRTRLGVGDGVATTSGKPAMPCLVARTTWVTPAGSFDGRSSRTGDRLRRSASVAA
jgi:hypothetical protein